MNYRLGVFGFLDLSDPAVGGAAEVQVAVAANFAGPMQKIAKAFVECLAIEIVGGQVEFEKEWYKCKKCFKLIEGIENHVKCKNCKSYEENELLNFNQIV